jgi:hypothetical protein
LQLKSEKALQKNAIDCQPSEFQLRAWDTFRGCANIYIVSDKLESKTEPRSGLWRRRIEDKGHI